MTAPLAGEESRINNVFLILVNPQMGENIGAVARVMHNFAISNLRLVAPRDGWPNPKANAMSAGGSCIIEQAEVFATLNDAISDLHLVYACTARKRDINKEIISPEEAAKTVQNNAIKIGIVAGPENSGLTNLDISLCNKIVTIPVSEKYKSINIAQSLGIICYELFKQKLLAPNIAPSQADVASKKDLDSFLNNLIHELELKNFFKVAAKKEKMIINLRSFFERVTNLSSRDIRTFYGILKSLIEK